MCMRVALTVRLKTLSKQSEFTDYSRRIKHYSSQKLPAQRTRLIHIFYIPRVYGPSTFLGVMSLTGKGQIDFGDDLDDPAGTPPRKGVVDFGDDDASEMGTSGKSNRRRSDQDSIREGKSKFWNQKRNP